MGVSEHPHPIKRCLRTLPGGQGVLQNIYILKGVCEHPKWSRGHPIGCCTIPITCGTVLLQYNAYNYKKAIGNSQSSPQHSFTHSEMQNGIECFWNMKFSFKCSWLGPRLSCNGGGKFESELSKQQIKKQLQNYFGIKILSFWSEPILISNTTT